MNLKKHVYLLGVLFAILGGTLAIASKTDGMKTLFSVIALLGCGATIPWKQLGKFLFDLNTALTISMIDSTWLLGTSPSDMEWVSKTLRDNLAGWGNPLSDYRAVHSSVKQAIETAFESGPQRVTHSPLLWFNCLKEIGADPKRIKPYITEAITPENELLNQIVYVAALLTPDP